MKLFKKIMMTIITVIASVIPLASCSNHDATCITPVEFLAMDNETKEECRKKVETGEYHFSKVEFYNYNGIEYCHNRCNEEDYETEIYEKFIDALIENSNHNSNTVMDIFINFLEENKYYVDILTVGCVKGGTVDSTSANISFDRNFWGIVNLDGSYHSEVIYTNDYYYAVPKFNYKGKSMILEISNTDYERMYKHFSESSDPLKFNVYSL